MFIKLSKSVATGAVTGLMLVSLFVTPAAAQSTGQSQGQSQGSTTCTALTPGAAPDSAATPLADCWLSIAPGQKQWYKFHAGARSNRGDENNNYDNNNGVDDSDAAIVQLVMDNPGCITFEVWTLARLNAPPPVGSDASSEAKRKDKEIARGPVGVGSPMFAIVDDNSSSSSNGDSASDDKNRNLARLIWRGGSTVPENFYIAVRNVRTDYACTYRLMVAGPTVSFPGTSNAAGNNNSSNSNNSSSNG